MRALQHDKALYPVQTVYPNGLPIFRLSPAFDLLRSDVFEKRHENVTPSALRQTREEYKPWPLDVFTQRIYQMERQWKFINYLEHKRSLKKIYGPGHDDEVEAEAGRDDMEVEESDRATKKSRTEN